MESTPVPINVDLGTVNLLFNIVPWKILAKYVYFVFSKHVLGNVSVHKDCLEGVQ